MQLPSSFLSAAINLDALVDINILLKNFANFVDSESSLMDFALLCFVFRYQSFICCLLNIPLLHFLHYRKMPKGSLFTIQGHLSFVFEKESLHLAAFRVVGKTKVALKRAARPGKGLGWKCACSRLPWNVMRALSGTEGTSRDKTWKVSFLLSCEPRKGFNKQIQ